MSKPAFQPSPSPEGSSDEEDYSRPRNYTGPIDKFTREQSRTPSASSIGSGPVTPSSDRAYAPPSGANKSSARRVGGSWVAREAMKTRGNVLRNVVPHKDFEPSSLKKRAVFSASFASDPSSTGSSPTGVNPRSASSGGMLESTEPFTQMRLMRNDADSPYLYAPSPEESTGVDQPYAFGQPKPTNAFTHPVVYTAAE